MSGIKYKGILSYFIGTMFLLLPFSLAYNFWGHQLELLSEPLLFVTVSMGLYYAYQKRVWKMSFLRHPLFGISTAYIVWALICSIFANHFFVAAKYSFVTLMHWWVYFCLWVIIFSKAGIFLHSNKSERRDAETQRRLITNAPYSNTSKHFTVKQTDLQKKVMPPLPIKGITTLWLLYGVSFALILFYAWWQHSQYGFSVDTSVLVARPFYFDHALYSCAALLLLGFVVPLGWGTNKQPWTWLYRILSVLLLLGVYLSFSRAAWLSLFGALFLTSIIAYFRPSFKQFIIGSSSLIILIIIGLSVLIPKQGSQVLSKQGDSWQHLRSTLNVSTDVSNLERLNRYSCAWRMFKTKPVFGYGPGNFIIDYYSFQRHEEMTRLSVTKHQKHRAGKGGGSHSQYLQALSEMGLIGFLLWILLILMSTRTAIHIIRISNNIFYRQMTLGILFGLLTFFIHSLFNNFFHQEKVMALVWSGMATLILMDREGNK